jgi:SET domain-containing protein
MKKKVRGSKYNPGGYDLRVKRSSAGLGLFAGEAIPKGKCVIEYVGRTISKKEEETSRSKYLFEINKNKTIDGKPKWNKAGYINHSCDPNCETDIYNGRVYVISIKPIKAGEELTYDYGEVYCLDHCMPCMCGAKTHLYKKPAKEKTEK